MKIISTPDTGAWRFKCDCSQCLSELEADAGDVRYAPETGGNQHDYVPSRLYVECPVCEMQLTIPDAGVPFMVQKQARNRNTDLKDGR